MARALSMTLDVHQVKVNLEKFAEKEILKRGFMAFDDEKKLQEWLQRSEETCC